MAKLATTVEISHGLPISGSHSTIHVYTVYMKSSNKVEKYGRKELKTRCDVLLAEKNTVIPAL